MRFFAWIGFFFFFAGCGFSGVNVKEMSITQFSKIMSGRSFTPGQKEDLAGLVQELHDHTRFNERCDKFRKVINQNETLLYFEEHYNLRPGFLYDEFLTLQAADIARPSADKSRTAALHILAAWKQSASTEQIDAIILKTRKCYPDDL